MSGNEMAKYHKALKLMKEQKWSAASEQLEDLYEHHHKADYVRYLARTLYFDHQYVCGMTYVWQAADDFYLNQEWASLALQLLLKSQYFIRARLFVANGSQKWQKEFNKRVETAERYAEGRYQETINESLKKFYHIGDVPVSGQKMRLEEAYHLPLAKFLKGAQFVLRDPFTHPLVRANIIDVLREIGVNKQLTYYWLDGKEYQVNPAELQPIGAIQEVKAVRKVISDRLKNDNPQLYNAALQQFNLQLMLLVPRIGMIITSPMAWADYLIARLTGDTCQVSEEVIKWQQLITEQIEKLTFDKE